jgi:hypothetical protein
MGQVSVFFISRQFFVNFLVFNFKLLAIQDEKNVFSNLELSEIADIV